MPRAVCVTFSLVSRLVCLFAPGAGKQNNRQPTSGGGQLFTWRYLVYLTGAMRKIFSKAETEIVLGRALLRERLKAGWISACAYRPTRREAVQHRRTLRRSKSVSEPVSIARKTARPSQSNTKPYLPTLLRSFAPIMDSEPTPSQFSISNFETLVAAIELLYGVGRKLSDAIAK
jgi:hypothetical protein